MIPIGQAGASVIWPGDASPEIAASGIATSPPLQTSSNGTAQFRDRILDAFRRSFVPGWPWLALLACAGYYIGARIGFALTFKPHPVSVLWPPNSILMATLILAPRRSWWILLLAVLPAHYFVQIQSGVPANMIICWYITNSFEAVLGAAGVSFLLPRPVQFNRLSNFAIFCLFGAFVGPFVSSFVDSAFVVWNHWGTGSYWELWRIRFASNVLAALTIVPFLVTWLTGGIHGLKKLPRHRYLETVIVVLGLVITSALVFNKISAKHDPALLYAPLPFLLWAAVRFGQRGATASIAALSLTAIWGAAHGHGPFRAQSAEENALDLQLFLIFMSAPLMFLAALTEERHQVEQTLDESEGRFRMMADATPIMIWMSGPDKLCTFVNKAWLNFTGQLFNDQLGIGWANNIHSVDYDQCLQTYELAFNAREPFEMQYRLRRQDGEYRVINDTGVPRYDAKRTFLGYVGACVDITDLLKKEKALHEIEERVALAAEAAQLGVWELDTKTNEMWVSDKVRTLFQFPDGPVTYDDFQLRIHPDDRGRRDCVLQDAIAMNAEYEAEYRIVLPDGKIRWIGGRARRVDNGRGKHARLIGVSMDVTKRKQAEELFRLATEASPSGVVLIDSDGRIVLANRLVEEIFGYESGDLVGKPVEDLLPGRFKMEYTPRREDFLATPEARKMGAGPELLGLRKDHTEFPVEIGWNPVQSPQGMLVLATVIDISARKAAEEEARQSREQLDLLGRVSLLGQMTASLAHELNQPLSAIVSNANAGMRFIERGAAHSDTLREILVDVANDGRRAHEIIRNVRSTIKKGSAIRERVNLNDLVLNVTHMIQPDALAHSCQVQTNLANDLPAVEVDPVQIQQVLINLLSNAFDAMSDIPVLERNVEVQTEHNSNDSVCLSVRDHGPGVRPEVSARLFEQFFTTKEEGLGMGLAIVHSIIEAHGGTIDVENVPTGGARFNMCVPINDGAKE